LKEIQTYWEDPKELKVVVPVKKQKKTTVIFPLPGHRVFELNLSTGIINEVKPEKQNLSLVPEIDIRTGLVSGSTTQKRGSVKMKEGCIYTTALNAKNADKHFHRILNKTYKTKK